MDPTPEDARNPHSGPLSHTLHPIQWRSLFLGCFQESPSPPNSSLLVSSAWSHSPTHVSTPVSQDSSTSATFTSSCFPPGFPSSCLSTEHVLICNPGTKVHSLEGKTQRTVSETGQCFTQGNGDVSVPFQAQNQGNLRTRRNLKDQFQDEESEVQKGRVTYLPSCT